MLNDTQMELLDINDVLKNYRVYARDYFMPRHSYFITIGGHKLDETRFIPLKKPLLDYKSLHADGGVPYFEDTIFLPYYSSKVKSFACESAKRQVEIQNCISLKRMAALREVTYNGLTFGLVGMFDGLEEKKENGWVWGHIPYMADNYARIANLAYSSTLTDIERLMLEHQMIVSDSRIALLTCSDGTPQNTVTGRYVSSPLLREHLLKNYADFWRQVQEGRYGQRAETKP